jgi:hypothetical protein
MNKIKLFYLLLLILVTVSFGCRRDYLCSCQTTDGVVEIIIKEAKEDEAEEVCTARMERKVLGAPASSCRLSGRYKKGES